MKISKIACVALLSASISTVAFAQTVDNYNAALAAQKKANEVASVIKNSVSTLKGLGIAKIADYGKDDGKNTEAENKAIEKALKDITDIKKDITDDVTIEDNGEKVVFTHADDKIKFTFTDGTVNELEIDTSDAKEAQKSISKIFTEKHKDIIEKLLVALDKKIPELLQKKDDRVQQEAIDFAKDPDNRNEFDAYVTHQDALLAALNKEIAQKTQDLAVKKSEADKKAAIKAELKKAFDEVKSSIDKQSTEEETNKKIEAFNKIVKDNKITLENANQAGNANIDENTAATKDDFADKLSRVIDSFDTGADSALKAAQSNLETANNHLSKFISFASDSDTILHQEEAIGNKNKDQQEKQKAFTDSITAEKQKTINEKVALKGTSAESIDAQAKAVTQAKANITAAKAKSDEDKKAAIVEAIKAGIPVKNGGKNLTEAEVDKLETGVLGGVLTSAEQDATNAENALNDAKTAAADLIKANNELQTENNKLHQASNARAKAVTKSQNLDAKQSDTLASLSDTILSNDKVQEVITKTSPSELAEIARNLHSSFEQSSKTTNQNITPEIINFSTTLATNTRLAKLSNPYNDEFALAQAINKLDGEAFADAGSSLSSIVQEYTTRYNYDNNLWGNIFGGKGKIKNSANPTIWGATLGYDKAFDNTIVGGYLNYSQTQAKEALAKHESDNYSLGVYTRSYLGQNEIDAKIAYGFGKNELNRDSMLGSSKGKYDSKFFDLSADYGYVFGLGDAKFIKPIVGLAYSHVKNDNFTESGKVAAKFNKTTTKILTAKIGTEFRVYAQNGNYFYVTPGIETQLSKKVDDLTVGFVGSSKDVTIDNKDKKHTYFAIKTGAEFKITNSLSTNLNFGAKAKSKEQYYNGTLGISYKF
ncbi:autotransporter domain-containing protein [Campylobacter sp. 9BO]|uniref:autotransporter outer membrane beta-barrel domain-containing protein n=1 Tax=Campylobacter sp. 9BO TaxID=3424759 RepID=UPI003D32AD6F